jgi:hypothetical protein
MEKAKQLSVQRLQASRNPRRHNNILEISEFPKDFPRLVRFSYNVLAKDGILLKFIALGEHSAYSSILERRPEPSPRKREAQRCGYAHNPSKFT